MKGRVEKIQETGHLEGEGLRQGKKRKTIRRMDRRRLRGKEGREEGGQGPSESVK